MKGHKKAILLIAIFIFIFNKGALYAQCGSIAFTSDVSTGCTPLSVNFKVSGAPSGSSFTWNFGGGAVSGVDTITKIFTKDGKYTVTLTVTGSSFSTPCVISKTDMITVSPSPVPHFSVSDTIVCNDKKAITFNDTTSDEVSRLWTINGDTFSTRSLNYTFKFPGSKAVSLKVTNAIGCTGTFDNNHFINAYDTLVSDFCATITVTDTNEYADFNATILNGSGRTITGYQWSFPGGSPSSYTGKTPPTVYYKDKTKSYDVSLILTTSEGCSYSSTRKAFLTPFVSFQDSICPQAFETPTLLAANNGRTNFKMYFPGGTYDPLGGTVYYYNPGLYDMSITFQYGTKAPCYTTVNYPGYLKVVGVTFNMSYSEALCHTNDTFLLANITYEYGIKNVQYTYSFYDSTGSLVKKITTVGKKDLRIVFGVPGIYSFNVEETNTFGCNFLKSYTKAFSIGDVRSDYTQDSINYCIGSDIQGFFIPKPSTPGKYKYFFHAHHSDSFGIDFDWPGNPLSANVFKPSYPGRYDVSLKIVDGKCSDSINKKKTIYAIGIYSNIIVDTPNVCLNPDHTCHLWLDTVHAWQYPVRRWRDYKYAWKVYPGDGVKIDSPNHRVVNIHFTQAGCYDVTLNIQDPVYKTCGTHFEVDNFICAGVPTGFTFLDSVCLGDTISISNYTVRDAELYQWEISPKKYSLIYPNDTTRTPSFIFYKDTCYRITLTASKRLNGKWCSTVFTKQHCIHVPKAKLYTKDTLLYCAPQPVHFHCDSNLVNRYYWDFGDGTKLTTNNPNPTHIYTQNSVDGFTVKLAVLDTLGCIDTTVKKNYVKVIGPVPRFSIESNVACDSVHLTFRNQSKDVTKYKLYFDDGSPYDTNSIVKHTYRIIDKQLDSMVFNPFVFGSDSSGCFAYFQQTIVLYNTPIADFQADQTEGCLPLKVHFTNNSTKGKKWYWDMDGDGKTDDTSKNPVFTYTKAGVYTVKLIVKGLGPCKDSLIQKAYIHVTAAPKADFTTNTKKICGHGAVSFTLTGNNYINYSWDYGDGSFDSNYSAAHIYTYNSAAAKSDSQVFYPRLRVYSGLGCGDMKTDTIIAYQAPIANYYTDVTEGCPPLTVKFTDTSQNAVKWEWDMDNDGKIDFVGRNPVWTFQTGVYTVKEKVYSKTGCIDSLVLVHLIRVNPRPKADFHTPDTVVCLHGSMAFTDWSSPAVNIRKWNWYFNDKGGPKDSSKVQNPVFTFNNQGWHNILLAIEDNKGCRDTIIKKTLYVEDTLPPKNTFIHVVSVNDNGKIEISWAENKVYDFARYKLKRDGSGVIDSFKSASDTQYIDTNAITNTISYCYRLQTIDKCYNQSIDTAYHCTIMLQTLAGARGNAKLSWNVYHGWQPKGYLIYRKYKGSSAWTQIASVSASTLTYNDSNLCEETYCYKIMAVNPLGIYHSYSNTECVSPPYIMHKPPVIQYATVTNNDFVSIFWYPDTLTRTFATYHVDRYSVQDGWKISYGITPQNSFIDKNVGVSANSYLYRIRTQDNCGYTTTYSDNASSIWLRSGIVDDKVLLYWNRYQLWPYGVASYKIQLKQNNGSFNTIANLKGSDSLYTDADIHTDIDNAYCYRVIAFQKSPNPPIDSSVSNIDCAVLPSRIYAPNAFSPNTDSLNDVWKISAISIYNQLGGPVGDFQMQIFNRWGTMVWQTNDVHKGWDGTYKGAPVQQDVYVYIINATGLDGKRLHLKGNISLLR